MSIFVQAYERLFELFGSTTLHNGKDMIFYPAIKKSRRKKLGKKYGLDPDELVLFARNLDAGSSFNHGLVLTDRGLRIRPKDREVVIPIPWSQVINVAYDNRTKGITVSFVHHTGIVDYMIPMCYFLKKKKYYKVGGTSIFVPLMQAMTHTTRAVGAKKTPAEILKFITPIPTDTPVKRSSASGWAAYIFVWIAALFIVRAVPTSTTRPK